jgi:hypothetical protein
VTAYAQGTSVPIDRSRAEIEQALRRRGATAFGYSTEGNHSQIMFKMMNRTIRLTVQRPSRDDKMIRYDGHGRKLSNDQADVRADREHRRRWRALVLILKAKLEAIHSGVLSIEEEFMPYMLLGDGRTVAEWAAEGLTTALDEGRMPRLLEAGQ